MRKKMIKDIKNIIKSMLDAHNHVIRLLQNKNVIEGTNLLAQCQDCAKHIGEVIESKKDFNEEVVFCLERYCEKLYEMSKTINKKKLIKLKGELDRDLNYVRDELDKEFPSGKTKIVFMPYKASMWDCMESIWEAAVSDKKCETYVVPIPYYERNSEGVIEKECYEADLFPDYVPIVPYKRFSLEVEQPDVIYIHNPYDAANYVTSVHPDYYSSKLKIYTDQLVYVPYFILGAGPLPDAHLSLPAYQYVDKIIVQDEEKAKSLVDFVPMNKIIVIGSPKVDYLLKLEKKKKEIIENRISEDWRKKIESKKVILFNISITGILNNSRCAMDKIRCVLQKFEKRDDVVLLWRPHPLMEATLKSMRPELYKEYIEIKDRFINLGKGILDETENPGIATVISDAYLGESTSSMVNYFGVLEKPILCIDWNKRNYEEKERNFLYILSFFREGDSLFFVPLNTGMALSMYSLNLRNGFIDKIKDFPGVSDNIWGAYEEIKSIHNKYILIPHNADHVYLYDDDKKQGIKFVLSEAFGRSRLFNGSIEYGDKLFLIPGCYPAIVAIDVKNMELCEFKECVVPFILEDKEKLIFSHAFFRKGDFLYLASGNNNMILIFNLKNGDYEIKKIGNYPYGYGYMIYDEDYFWLSACGRNCVVRWNEKSGETVEYTYPMEQEYSEDVIWGMLINKEEEIVICNGFSFDIFFVSKKTGECRKDERVENILNQLRKGAGKLDMGFRSVVFLDKETVLLTEWSNFNIHIWNIYTNQWKSYPCRIPMNTLLNFEKEQIEKHLISKAVPYHLSENVIAISQFIDYIIAGNTAVFKKKYECYGKNVDEQSIGFRIHECMSN